MARNPFTVNKFKLSFVGWWLMWTIMHTIFLIWLDIGLWTAVKESLISNFLLAGTCTLIISNLKYYRPNEERYWYLGLVSLVLCSAWMFASKYVLISVSANDQEYLIFLNRTLPVRFGIGFLLIACMTMVSMMWYSLEDQKENEKRKAEAESLAKEAELSKLRHQLQPHFLFNCLNSINALIGINAEDARRMIQQLSDFLRSTIKTDDKQWVALDEELKYLELYLSIEKQRFGHRLTARVEADEDCLSLLLPNLLLQPIVENAIKFGLYDTTGEIAIIIKASCATNILRIEVENPYDAESTGQKPGTGFGLSSVQRRLQLLFGRSDLLQTLANGHMFTAILEIPQKNLSPDVIKMK